MTTGISNENNNNELLCREGRISLSCYLITAILVFLPFALQINENTLANNTWSSLFWSPLLYVVLYNMILRFLYSATYLQIAVRASFLGLAQGASALVICYAPVVWRQFGVYGTFLAFFHFSEFFAIAWSNPRTLTVDSFILNHSVHYAMAAFASWLEFCIEVNFLPEFKTYANIWLFGVVICICGEIVRKTAIITASSNFTHLVQYEKEENHKLVTHGIYAYARHPSYTGWFLWSIGTQIILFNPICIILYTIVSWQFFRDRIFMEEITLLQFFGIEYYKYQHKVPTGLPFINGYVVHVKRS